MNYTLMGDNVNLGARLEGTNKQYMTNVIISESTYAQVKDKVIARELDIIRVKGKNKPTPIFELIDVIGDRVVVATRGTCAVCQASQATLKGFVESRLRELVAPEIVVEEESR